MQTFSRLAVLTLLLAALPAWPAAAQPRASSAAEPAASGQPAAVRVTGGNAPVMQAPAAAAAAATALTIAQIQGSGLVSPHQGATISTEGMVTAILPGSGYFLQSSSDDGDASTSDAVFVFTAGAAVVSVGQRVRVTAVVQEYTADANPHQLSVTRLITPMETILADPGPALPAPLQLDPALLQPQSGPAALEPFEGMRVSMAEAVVVGASGGNIVEENASASSDGIFTVTLAGLERPFREAGINVLDTVPIPASKDIARFDNNPERLMVRSGMLAGSLPLAVDTEATISGLRGVLDYHDGSWALLTDADAAIAINGGRLPTTVSEVDHNDITVAQFNLQRLFDEVADGNGAPTLTPQALDRRLQKAALAICDYLKAPDIIGVVEVENLRLLQLLSERIDQSCASAPAYTPYLQPGNSASGLNVGFLVSSRTLPNGKSRVEVSDVAQLGKQSTVDNPDGSKSVLHDQPPLRLRALINQDLGIGYPLTVLINDLRSLDGINDTSNASNGWATTGDRVRNRRARQAIDLATRVEQMQQANPAEHIVVLGGFNAFAFNDGYVDVMGIIAGTPAAAEQVLLHLDSPLTTPLVDISRSVDATEAYSYVSNGNAQALDHVLVSQALLEDAPLRVEHARINADFGADLFEDDTLAIRSSDHDPLRMVIELPEPQVADLSVSLRSDVSRAYVGETVFYTAAVRNNGPSTALPVVLAFVFNANFRPVVDLRPQGWSCSQPSSDGSTTTIICSTASLAAEHTAMLGVQAVMPASAAGAVLSLGADVESNTQDPEPGNNASALTVGVPGPRPDTRSDLWIDVPQTVTRLRGGRAALAVDYGNLGPSPAEQAVISLYFHGSSEAIQVTAPSGWVCGAAEDADTALVVRCRALAAMPVGSSQVVFQVPPEVGSNGSALQWSGYIYADNPDPDGSNNYDSGSSSIR